MYRLNQLTRFGISLIRSKLSNRPPVHPTGGGNVIGTHQSLILL